MIFFFFNGEQGEEEEAQIRSPESFRIWNLGLHPVVRQL